MMYRVVVSSVMLAMLTVAVGNSYAQTDVTILDDSILTEFTNVYDTGIDRLAIWFTTNHTIQSYVAEPGWRIVHDDTSLQMVNGMLEPGQSIKVGLKFQGDGAQIAWMAANGDDTLAQGWLLREDTTPTDDAPSPDGILAESAFRTIPAKPAIGSTIRLVGVDFAPNHRLHLDVENIDMGHIITDSDGSFITTLTLPDSLQDRIEFNITDELGNRAPPLSLRLETAPLNTHADITLSITSIKEAYHLGDSLDISGTGQPNTVIAATLFSPQGEMISTTPIKVDASGTWSVHDIITIPLSSDFGDHTITIKDGRNTIDGSWSVESDTHILVKAVRSMFEPGESLRFSGEAMPDIDLTVMLYDPGGQEIVIDTISTGPDGTVSWEYPTNENSRQGTYTLILSHETERQFAYAGLGSEVEVPIRVSFDQANYLPSDRPVATIEGMPDESITLLVTDPTDTIVFRDAITLQNNGRTAYEINIQNFSTGIYTAIVQKGTTQSSYRFGVGLATSATEIDIGTIKNQYTPGEQVQILGTATPNAIIRITLLDPDGNIVQAIDTFSDRSGQLSERQIRIPLEAASGDWVIRASSGQKLDTAVISVGNTQQGVFSVDVKTEGQSATIVINGASSTYVTVTILNDGVLEQGPLRAYITSEGTGTLPWSIDISGTYTIIVEDGPNVTQTTYHFERK